MKHHAHNKELAAHVARVQGQLAAVHEALLADDCHKATRTLCAASRSLASLRATCASEFVSRRVYRGAQPSDAVLLEDVRALMRA